MSEENLSQEYFDVLKSKYNLSILSILEKEGEATPRELSDELEINEQSASNRMWRLRHQGLLESEDERKWVENVYELAGQGEEVVEALNAYVEDLDHSIRRSREESDDYEVMEIAAYNSQGVMFDGGVIAPDEHPEKEYSKALVREINAEGFPGMTTVEVVEYLEPE